MAFYKITEDTLASGGFSKDGACANKIYTMEVKTKPLKAGDTIQGEIKKVFIGKSLVSKDVVEFIDSADSCLLWRVDAKYTTPINTLDPVASPPSSTPVKKGFKPTFSMLLAVGGAAGGVIHGKMEKRSILGMALYGLVGALAGYGLGMLVDKDAKANEILNKVF